MKINVESLANSSQQLNQDENLVKLTAKKRSSIMVSRCYCSRCSSNRRLFQYPSPAAVTDKYEFGKKMGDGNFALVCRSKSRENQREFAIKIIDKSKMKVTISIHGELKRIFRTPLLENILQV